MCKCGEGEEIPTGADTADVIPADATDPSPEEVTEGDDVVTPAEGAIAHDATA